MERNAFVAIIAAVVATMVVVVYLGDVRWKEKTAAIRSGLDRARVEANVAVSGAAAELPGPVRRDLDAVLPEGTPNVIGVTLRHAGRFNMSETGERWTPFTSDQTATMRRPGFDWDARIRSAGGVNVATPWGGRLWNYERRSGILVPLDGEVSWLLPDGPKPYWRGRITDIRHEFAR